MGSLNAMRFCNHSSVQIELLTEDKDIYIASMVSRMNKDNNVVG